MSNREIGITPEQFQQLNHLMGLELDSEPVNPDAESQCGRVISLAEFRQSKGLENSERQKARGRARQWLKVLAGLVRDYEGQMLAIAHERPREEWKELTGYDPYEQIAFDVERLETLLGHLNWALEERGVATLEEARDLLAESEDEILRATLDYVGQSEYLGFEVIRQLFSVGAMVEGVYVEDEALTHQFLQTLEANQFVFAIAPLRSLQDREVLAS